MDFLEIRRKAKQRAEARARADVPVRPDDGEAPEPLPSWTPEPAPAAGFVDVEPFEAVLQAVAAAGGELTPIPDLPANAPADGERDALFGHGERDLDSAPAAGRPPAPRAAPIDPLDDFFYRADETAPELPDLHFDPAARRAGVEVLEPRREYLTFLLGDEEYAIDIERVREVLKAPAITDVPRAPDHVLGVIMVRGDVIAVFDPRRRLGLPPAGGVPMPRVVVCDDGMGPIGLLVDAVSQVVRLRRSEIEARPQGIGGVSAEYISGIGRQSGRMFIVLDLPVVLRGKVSEVAEDAR